MTTGVSGFSFSAFQAKYKYRIGGAEDALLRSVGSLIKDDAAFRLFKNSRQTEINNIASIAASEPDPALRAAATAKAKLAFLEKSGRLLNDLTREGETKAKLMAPALSNVSAGIKAMVDDYLANTADSPEDQTAFLNRVKALVDRLQRIALQQKPRLRAEGQYYNVSMVRATRLLSETETAVTARLGSFGGGGAAASTSETPIDGTGGTVDITV